jgi:hypothetical protein
MSDSILVSKLAFKCNSCRYTTGPVAPPGLNTSSWQPHLTFDPNGGALPLIHGNAWVGLALGTWRHFSPRHFAVKTHSNDDSRYVPCNQPDTRDAASDNYNPG